MLQVKAQPAWCLQIHARKIIGQYPKLTRGADQNTSSSLVILLFSVPQTKAGLFGTAGLHNHIHLSSFFLNYTFISQSLLDCFDLFFLQSIIFCHATQQARLLHFLSLNQAHLVPAWQRSFSLATFSLLMLKSLLSFRYLTFFIELPHYMSKLGASSTATSSMLLMNKNKSPFSVFSFSFFLTCGNK